MQTLYFLGTGRSKGLIPPHSAEALVENPSVVSQAVLKHRQYFYQCSTCSRATQPYMNSSSPYFKYYALQIISATDIEEDLSNFWDVSFRLLGKAHLTCAVHFKVINIFTSVQKNLG